MQPLQIFDSNEFGQVRTVVINDEPWFVGKDVAEALEHSNSRQAIKVNVQEEDKDVILIDTPGGRQKITIINESGLYSLILSSRLPSAKKFKRWVTSEVLPSLRKSGGYLTQEAQRQIAAAVQGQIADIVAQTVPAVVAEVMKQVLPVLTETSSCASGSSAGRKPERKRNRVRVVSKVDYLPVEIKGKVMEMLTDPRFHYDEIVVYCQKAGHSISRSSLCRYSQRLQKQFGNYEFTME